MSNTKTKNQNWLISIILSSGREITFHKSNKTEDEIRDLVNALWKDSQHSNDVVFYDKKYQHAGHIDGSEIVAITYVKFA